MKKLIWAKTIFESYKYLSRLISSIDRLVMEKSVHSYTVDSGESTTLAKMEAIIDLIQRKKRLLIVKWLVEESIKNTDRQEARILIKFYIDKVAIDELADEYKMNNRTLARRMNKYLRNCMDRIYDLGYKCEDFERLLENEGWIIGVYNSIVDRFKKSHPELVRLKVPTLHGIDKVLSLGYGRQVKSNVHSTV